MDILEVKCFWNKKFAGWAYQQNGEDGRVS